MRGARYLLSIDQGTSSTRATIYNRRLQPVGTSQQEIRVFFPKPGWVEQDLGTIWTSTERCIAGALRDARIPGARIDAVGITNQRETTALWRRDRATPVYRAIVWQDRRAAPLCDALAAEGALPSVQATTGLVLDPYFSAGKLRWILDNVKGAGELARSGALAFGTIDAWLMFRMSSGRIHATDASNASRTSLYGLSSGDWEASMLDLFGIPEAVLPKVRQSAGEFGTTLGMKSLPDGIPITGVAGDQQAALFGQGCFQAGDAKCTFGTGAFLLMNIGAFPTPSKAGLLTTVAWQLGERTTYAIEGSAFVAGAAVQWLRDGLKLFARSTGVEALARTVPDSAGVQFVPALAGLGAPHWRPEARGLLMGITRGTKRGHVARAVLEGIALQNSDLARAMNEDMGMAMSKFRVDGGAAQNNLLMQFQADILGIPVVRPKRLESTGLGAAMLAGLGVGWWQTPGDIPLDSRGARTFIPKMEEACRHVRLGAWQRAVERA